MAASSVEWIELVSALLAMIPLVALTLAWFRSRSPRVLMAAAAFLVFVFVRLVIFAGEYASGLASASEWLASDVETSSDVVIMALFAASFLWPQGAARDVA